MAIIVLGFYKDSLTQLKKVCVSPFSVDGFELNGCQTIGQREWCATGVNHNRDVTEWSYCDQSDSKLIMPKYSVY